MYLTPHPILDVLICFICLRRSLSWTATKPGQRWCLAPPPEANLTTINGAEENSIEKKWETRRRWKELDTCISVPCSPLPRIHTGEAKLLSQRSAKRELRHTYFRRKLLFLTVMTFKFPRGVRHTLGRKFRARLHAISLHPCCVLKLPRYRINRWRRVYCTVYEGQVSGTYE